MSQRYEPLGLQEDKGDSSPVWTSSKQSFDNDSENIYSGASVEKFSATISGERQRRSTLVSIISLPIALHVGVLLFYICLCVMWAAGIEQNIEMPFESAAHVQTWLNLISHLIMLGFSTAIVAVMQPIATRSPFGNLPQTLTSLSDKISSWNGLGSSLLNLYHNSVFPTTIAHAFFTTLYFATLSGLGISSSFLFSVPTVNQLIVTPDVPTQVGSPSVESFVFPGSGLTEVPSDFTNLTFDWFRSGAGVGMLLGGNATFPGLSANRIYDTLLTPVSSLDNPTAVVGFTDFNVKCGSIPNIHMSAITTSEYNNSIVNYSSTAVSVSSDQRHAVLLSGDYFLGDHNATFRDVLSVSHNLTSNTSISRLWQPADVLVRVPTGRLAQGIGRNLILYNVYNETGNVAGSQPILDSEGLPGSPWTVRVDPYNGSDPGLVPITRLLVQPIGCSLTTTRGQTTIDARTNLLIDDLGLFPGATAGSVWNDWRPDLISSNVLEDTWARMFVPNIGSVSLWGNQNSLPHTSPWKCGDYGYQWLLGAYGGPLDSTTTADSCHIPTAIEDYLTTRIFGPVTSRSDYGETTRDPSVGNATLSALESSLASATAMAMWSAARASTFMVTYFPTNYAEIENASRVQGKTQWPATVIAAANHTTSVTGHIQVARIKFYIPTLLLGTGLAILLVVLCFYILVHGDAAHKQHAPIKDAGLLSLMTLDNSDVAARLSTLNTGNVKARRRAGDFLVRVVDGRLVVVEDSDSTLPDKD